MPPKFVAECNGPPVLGSHSCILSEIWYQVREADGEDSDRELRRAGAGGREGQERHVALQHGPRQPLRPISHSPTVFLFDEPPHSKNELNNIALMILRSDSFMNHQRAFIYKNKEFKTDYW